MFSPQDYLWGWLLYILASAGLLIVWWYLTRFIGPALLRQLLRVAAAAALLMPYPIERGSEFWAPALPMAFLEGLFVVDANFVRVGIPLVFTVLLALIAYLAADRLWFWAKRRWWSNRQPTTDDEATSDSTYTSTDDDADSGLDSDSDAAAQATTHETTTHQNTTS